ncbi:hypothetical protein BACPEC_01922 [[Bacteroides] pectinophilus ATCC 43243]|uniref:Uncharacterized protein n=1 Tax=[Bacteroides] pectinophilus ATCC 43243 TaxID=483218 RepID=B7AS67_9FIRM|nr:hypothetical protein BACPEC_01922 [[Bacteroides] pectinophilus ATCC 43243]
MDNAKLFLIGEVAKMYRISMGTRRHYEQPYFYELKVAKNNFFNVKC